MKREPLVDKTVLSEAGTADILAVIYEEGSANMSRFYRISKGYKALTTRIDQLVEAGLVTKEAKFDDKLQYDIRLTPKGIPIGKRMSECRRILRGMEVDEP